MSDSVLRATHEGDLILGGSLSIPSYVLPDGQRILSGRNFMLALGVRGHGKSIAHRMASILTEHISSELIYHDILMRIETPIKFRDSSNILVIGYEAQLLIDYADAFLKARQRRAIRTAVGYRYAEFSELITRACAKVGIVALIDEATGYQAVRARDDLQKLLGKFIRADLADWVKTFPDAFYQEIGRLKGWKSLIAGKRPGVLGHITNDIVYSRLAPGVIVELQRLNPRLPEGGRGHHHHRHMTDDVGYPALKQHLDRIIFLMQASSTWNAFERSLDRAAPKFNDTLPLLLMTPDGELA